MSDMISVASGFQYSVNIGYDLNDNSKLKNFIPTKSALNLLEDILLSTNQTSTERSRVLIGAYGKGKSHIVLMIMSILMKKDITLFEKMMPKVKLNERLYQAIQNYYESGNKILPVVVMGSNTSLSQAFLLALQRTLNENDLLDVMPETNYKAAIASIERWKEMFPETYEKFKKSIDIPVTEFIQGLEDYDIELYETFEKVYPTLTAGSLFNPFLGFDVVELYEGVIKGLKKKGYTGIYVIYDEFSKYLEANISEASVSDTKMLQDFAEKCNRSGSEQMHLMLISHKEIANYIDKLPKQKVDGWRGVSERFLHVHLNNNFTQTYEIIASVIQKDKTNWKDFCDRYDTDFTALKEIYASHSVFSDTTAEDMEQILYGCYPLHPVSTFILPRLSERIAQNERTLFTFLSANGISTLPAFLNNYFDDEFKVVTPDLIYDYFEPLLKKEVYSGELYRVYTLTKIILENLDSSSLASKIVKTISLIYILEQFEKIKPTKGEIADIFSVSYTVNEINDAIKYLIDEEYVVYLKRSNEYLQLKQASGVNIREKIKDTIESQKRTLSIKGTLNTTNLDNYMYPSRYNDMKEMTRYFTFEFIEEEELVGNIDWNVKSEGIEADGIVYAIIPKNKESLSELKQKVAKMSEGYERFIFIVPKKYTDIVDVVREFDAVSLLRDKAEGDKILFDEYDVIYGDLIEVINTYVSSYTHPEKHKSTYIYNGSEISILRRAELTGLMSDICDKIFNLTPVINNEAINKMEPTSTAITSRNKIIAGLLRNELEINLGLSGSGQEVSIMRSTLIRTGILSEKEGVPFINLQPDDPNLSHLLNTIEEFIKDAGRNGDMSFKHLYDKLLLPQYHIGLRKGLIPIYLSVVFHEYRQQVVIKDSNGMHCLSNVDTLVQINANPVGYKLSYLDWNPDRENYIQQLEKIFKEYIIESEKNINSYDYVALAMRRWYMSLPRYVREIKKRTNGDRVLGRYINFINSLKRNLGSQELLFEKLPQVFNYQENFELELAGEIANVRNYYDKILDELKLELIFCAKQIFSKNKIEEYLKQVSLTSVIQEWCEKLEKTVFEQLFIDGTDKCLNLFKTITNDENTFILRLAKTATDLRIEDWDDSTYTRFKTKLQSYKKTAEEYHVQESISSESNGTNSYQMTFIDEKGKSVTKRFDKVESTKRGKLLYNSITSQLEAMGTSITEQEKRQILMEILKEMC